MSKSINTLVDDVYRLMETKEAEDSVDVEAEIEKFGDCLLYTSPSPRDVEESRMPSSA